MRISSQCPTTNDNIGGNKFSQEEILFYSQAREAMLSLTDGNDVEWIGIVGFGHKNLASGTQFLRFICNAKSPWVKDSVTNNWVDLHIPPSKSGEKFYWPMILPDDTPNYTIDEPLHLRKFANLFNNWSGSCVVPVLIYHKLFSSDEPKISFSASAELETYFSEVLLTYNPKKMNAQN